MPDATVELHFRKADPGNIVEIIAPAKRATTSNKPAYAAQVTLPSIGSWNLPSRSLCMAKLLQFSANLAVLTREENPLPHWPYFAVLPLLLLLLIWIRWLKRQRRLRRSQAPP